MATQQQTQQQGVKVPPQFYLRMGYLGSFGWARGRRW